MKKELKIKRKRKKKREKKNESDENCADLHLIINQIDTLFTNLN